MFSDSQLFLFPDPQDKSIKSHWGGEDINWEGRIPYPQQFPHWLYYSECKRVSHVGYFVRCDPRVE